MSFTKCHCENSGLSISSYYKKARVQLIGKGISLSSLLKLKCSIATGNKRSCFFFFFFFCILIKKPVCQVYILLFQFAQLSSSPKWIYFQGCKEKCMIMKYMTAPKLPPTCETELWNNNGKSDNCSCQCPKKDEEVLNVENPTSKANLHKRADLEFSLWRLNLCHIKYQKSALKWVIHQFNGKLLPWGYFLLISDAWVITISISVNVEWSFFGK